MLPVVHQDILGPLNEMRQRDETALMDSISKQMQEDNPYLAGFASGYCKAMVEAEGQTAGVQAWCLALLIYKMLQCQDDADDLARRY